MFKTTYKPVSEYKKKARFITTHAVKPKGAYEWCILAVIIKNRHKERGINDSPVFSGAKEDRTPDPLLAKQVLSQLSYNPMYI